VRSVVERRELAGVPGFWSPQDHGLPVAGVTFRVGRVDETAATAGITHLVEHLALPARSGHIVDFNGTVETYVASFYCSGEPADVRSFVAATAALLADLPLERLEVERRILLAEDATRGSGGARLALKLRFGAVGAGLVGFEEYGLRRVRPEDVTAWSSAYFTRENAALWVVGIDPDDLELPLPPGERRPRPPDPVQLADLTTPALFASGWETGFCLSFVAKRSAATVLALDVLANALRDRLRYELGLSYAIEPSSQPLSADLTHLVITGDAADESAGEWLAAALDVLQTLASDVDDESLESVKASHRRSEAEPGATTGFAAWCADQELLGVPFESQADVRTERDAVNAKEASSTIQAFASTLLVLGPDSTPLLDGLVEYPYTSRTMVDGRSVRPTGVRSRLRRGGSRLVVGAEGVSIVGGDGRAVTARYADTVLCLRGTARRTLLTNDGFYVTVDAEDWSGGRAIVAELDAALPEEIVVSEAPMPDERSEAVRELADATFKRTWLVSEELEVLPQLLEGGETMVALAAGSRGWRYGLIAVTDRRLRFLYGDGSKHSLDVDRRDLRAKADGSTLEVLVDDEWISFVDVGPKGKAAELAELLQTDDAAAT
jgi:zinc protease